VTHIYFLKPFLDSIIALLILIILSPVLIVSIFLIIFSSRGPFFFIQERLGKKGTVFKLYKLRTMTHKKRDADREILKGDPELTKIGVLLRRFKIDEIPQFINILKGDMSIVGPRPCLPEQLKDFDKNGHRRIEVKPGLTGLAQINGNIHLSWPERWVYDKEYVENISFWLDIRIIFTTISIVIFGEDKFIKRPHV
jgi:undecaprenyl phosphate N,N'-diacetylbacillosamine 1-phosphate transferase